MMSKVVRRVGEAAVERIRRMCMDAWRGVPVPEGGPADGHNCSTVRGKGKLKRV